VHDYNIQIEQHLIVLRRPNFYVALPKGPVADEHFLIVPNKHIGHSLELDDAQEEELTALKQQLIDYLTNKRQMDYIVFERNVPFSFSKAAHMNLQIIGLQAGALEERVRKLLKTMEGQARFFEIEDRERDLRQELSNDPSKHFFYLEIPGMKTAKGRQRLRFFSEIQAGQRFDMQFGRVLACHLMNQREKINWKNCQMDRQEEERLAAHFRTQFS